MATASEQQDFRDEDLLASVVADLIGDVRHVAVDGTLVVVDQALGTLEVPRIRDRARAQAARVLR